MRDPGRQGERLCEGSFFRERKDSSGVDSICRSTRSAAQRLEQPSRSQSSAPNLHFAHRDRVSSHLLAPPTPPDKRVRIRRFEELRSTETGDTELIGPA